MASSKLPSSIKSAFMTLSCSLAPLNSHKNPTFSTFSVHFKFHLKLKFAKHNFVNFPYMISQYVLCDLEECISCTCIHFRNNFSKIRSLNFRSCYEPGFRTVVRTVCPLSSSDFTMYDAMKPVPPVTQYSGISLRCIF